MISYAEYLAEATRGNDAKINIVAIQGSPRTRKSCSGGDSKTAFLLKKAMESVPKDVKFDLLDLCVLDTEPQVRPCKGCIGTSNGFHCHFPCSCYAKGDGTDDFMHEKGVYDKLRKADGFVVFTPVHWFGPTSQVKAMFDRLVCVNLTLSVEDAKRIMGDKGYKDPEVTRKTELSGEHRDLLKNHLEGKVGAFFIHGDDGANDYKGRRMPLSMLSHGDKEYIGPRQSIMPIVNQCRYSGIFVPESCIEEAVFGYGHPYAENDRESRKSERLIKGAERLVSCLIEEIKKRKRT